MERSEQDIGIIEKLFDGFQLFYNNGSLFEEQIVLLNLPKIRNISCENTGKIDKIEIEVPYESNHLLFIFLEILLHHKQIGVSKINVSSFFISYDMNVFVGDITDALVAMNLNGLDAAEKLKLNVKRNITTTVVFDILDFGFTNTPEILFMCKETIDIDWMEIEPTIKVNKIPIKY